MMSKKIRKFISTIVIVMLIAALLPVNLSLAASYKTVEDFVKNLYVAGLGREPEIEGYNYWVNELKKGRSAAEVIGYVLLDSSEFQEKYKDIPNEEFVKKAYEIVFNRSADEEGLKFWVEQMERGGSQKYIIVAMLYAPTGEFQEFCDAVGINLGNLEVAADEYPEDVSKPEEPTGEEDSSDTSNENESVLYISFEEGEEEIYSLSQPDKSKYEYVKEGVTDGSRALKVTVTSLTKQDNVKYSELVINSGAEGWDFGDGILKLDVKNPEDYTQQMRVIITDGNGTKGTYYFSFEANESRTLEISEFGPTENKTNAGDGYWGITNGLDKTNIKSIIICLWEYHTSLRDDSVNTSSFIVDNIRVE